MAPDRLAPRLRALPRVEVCGRSVPVAVTRRARLLGLAFLPAELAGPGLLLPRCRSIHTYGMRFAIDVLFLDGRGNVVRRIAALPSRRFVIERRASAVLERPAADRHPPGGVAGPVSPRRSRDEDGVPDALGG